jgi:integrase/recombinase XerC
MDGESLHGLNKKKTSIARKLASLRTFFQFLIREGVAGKQSGKARRHAENRAQTADASFDGRRRALYRNAGFEHGFGQSDRAILEFLYATGMRVGELVNLNLKDIDFREKLVRVTGKRKKQSILPFGEPSLQALDVLPKRSARRFSQ